MSDVSETSERIDADQGWTLAEVFAETGVPAVTLRHWIYAGDLPAWRYRKRGPWRVKPADVAHLIQTNRSAAA